MIDLVKLENKLDELRKNRKKWHDSFVKWDAFSILQRDKVVDSLCEIVEEIATNIGYSNFNMNE